MEAIVGLILLVIVIAGIWSLRKSIASWAAVAEIKSNSMAASVACDSQSDLHATVERLKQFDKLYDSATVLKAALGKVQIAKESQQ